MMPRMFATFTSSAQFWAARSDQQRAIAVRHLELHMPGCHRTMLQLAAASRAEAERALNLARLLGE